MWGFRSRTGCTALSETDADDDVTEDLSLLAEFADRRRRQPQPLSCPTAMRRALTCVAVALAVTATARAQAPSLPVDESVREQSCKLLQGGSAGTPDQAPAGPVAPIPASWPEAPAAAGLPKRVFLRTATETFNRLYEFATRKGAIYVRNRSSSDPWRTLPLPLCFDGHAAPISLDDAEMIA